MDGGSDRRTSPAPSCAVVEKCRGTRWRVDEDDGGDPSCTGKSCQSCTAGAIADCVAVCCCPCAVVNFLALALVKLPWAVARRFIDRRRRKRRRRRLEEEGISERGTAAEGEGMSTSDVVLSGAAVSSELNDHFGAEDVWLEVGHLGFGRVSFNGFPYQDKGNLGNSL